MGSSANLHHSMHTASRSLLQDTMLPKNVGFLDGYFSFTFCHAQQCIGSKARVSCVSLPPSLPPTAGQDENMTTPATPLSVGASGYTSFAPLLCQAFTPLMTHPLIVLQGAESLLLDASHLVDPVSCGILHDVVRHAQAGWGHITQLYIVERTHHSDHQSIHCSNLLPDGKCIQQRLSWVFTNPIPSIDHWPATHSGCTLQSMRKSNKMHRQSSPSKLSPFLTEDVLESSVTVRPPRRCTAAWKEQLVRVDTS
ncbi:hypothetical protein E2C01_029709 [Portunus trituberculatus]|uniref:Uncharacterized protein n=1 Tax=Portunus trituberculatus TaxID=210409 RepID=A0A5B7ESN8_PORTR|nr:hypothetical protein [Portunus trituberculatus]